MLLADYGPVFFIAATVIMYLIFIPLFISEWKNLREQERKFMHRKKD